MPAGDEVARFRMDLAIHPGGDAPGDFFTAYLKQTASPAVEDLALWDVLAAAVGLAGADRTRPGLEEIGISLDSATVARRATSILEERWLDADTALATQPVMAGRATSGGQPRWLRHCHVRATRIPRPGREADGLPRERKICAPLATTQAALWAVPIRRYALREPDDALVAPLRRVIAAVFVR